MPAYGIVHLLLAFSAMEEWVRQSSSTLSWPPSLFWVCVCITCASVCLSVRLLQDGSGATSSDGQRRREEFLQQLHSRLVEATEQQQQGANSNAQLLAAGQQPDASSLKRLVTKHGMEDWMQVRLYLFTVVTGFERKRA